MAVAWNLLTLRAETRAVTYLDDSSVHAQMVRFASSQLSAGHLPLTSWFPYLGLGSPQFLHYQSVPAMLAGLIGIATGPGAAFRWTLYLLVSLWPVSIYVAARLFGFDRWGAAAAALLSPFLSGVTGVGYEQVAYLWVGYGVWTQLWASVTLPLAWGLGWRAVRDGRGFFWAVLAVAATAALHFETGYLAMIPLLLWPFVSLGRVRERLVRAALVLGGSLLAAAWVIVPLLVERPWAATNEVLHRTPLVNGYGAGRVLSWLVTGQTLDHGRIPLITVFAGIGLLVLVRRWRVDENGRSLVVAVAVCLLLSFGRAGLGGLVDVIPGHADIFFRRFMMGVQLASLLMAGVGAGWCARRAWGLGDLAWKRLRAGGVRRFPHALVTGSLVGAAAVLLLAPAWSQSLALDQRNARAIATQAAADRSEGAEVDRLVRIAKQRGAGRVYAGMPSNWGANFRVGAVPVFKYLEARDTDEVGYTLRTASLMTGPEYYFDERNPSNYLLFGIRYLLVPATRFESGVPAPVTSVPLACAGYYCLRELPWSGYVHGGRLVGALTLTRSSVGSATLPVLRSGLAQDGAYVRAEFGPRRRGLPRIPTTSPGAFPGTVVTESTAIHQGKMVATVRLRRPGIAVLSASFDHGWRATVDGRPVPTLAVAPALVAARVPAGTHTVVFRYEGFSWYPELFVLAAATLLALAVFDWRRGGSRGGAHGEESGSPSHAPRESGEALR